MTQLCACSFERLELSRTGAGRRSCPTAQFTVPDGEDGICAGPPGARGHVTATSLLLVEVLPRTAPGRRPAGAAAAAASGRVECRLEMSQVRVATIGRRAQNIGRARLGRTVTVPVKPLRRGPSACASLQRVLVVCGMHSAVCVTDLSGHGNDGHAESLSSRSNVPRSWQDADTARRRFGHQIVTSNPPLLISVHRRPVYIDAAAPSDSDPPAVERDILTFSTSLRVLRQPGASSRPLTHHHDGTISVERW